jgi:integrase
LDQATNRGFWAGDQGARDCFAEGECRRLQDRWGDPLDKLRELFHDKITAILAPINRENPTVKAAFTLGEFIKQNYFLRLEYRLGVPTDNDLHIEPATVKGYKDIWKVHVEDKQISKIQLRNFTARDARNFLELIPQQLSHNTHMRIKAFLSGVFSWATADSAFQGANPFEDQKAGGRKKGETSFEGLTEGERRRKEKIKASNEHAYTLEEVAEMLDKLPEPARTVCAVAALTGLTRSELKGLKWTDYDGDTISVKRKV